MPFARNPHPPFLSHAEFIEVTDRLLHQVREDWLTDVQGADGVHTWTLGVNNPLVKKNRGRIAPSVPGKMLALPRMCWAEDPCPACRAYGVLADGSPIPGDLAPAEQPNLDLVQ